MTINIETSLQTWLASVLGIPVHIEHLDDTSSGQDDFALLLLDGDEMDDELNPVKGELPEVVYVDLEIYSRSKPTVRSLTKLLRAQNGYEGPVGTGVCQDITVENVVGDYSPQAEAADLPEHMNVMRLTVTMYEELPRP